MFFQDGVQVVFAIYCGFSGLLDVLLIGFQGLDEESAPGRIVQNFVEFLVVFHDLATVLFDGVKLHQVVGVPQSYGFFIADFFGGPSDSQSFDM